VRSIDCASEREKLGKKLDPELRELLDRVIVPALARDYIAEHRSSDRLAVVPKSVQHFDLNDRLSAEGIQ
jgi:hypothetical protein